MNRRTAVKLLVGLPFFGSLPQKTQAQAVPPKYGPPLRAVYISHYQPTLRMIAVEVPVDHPPIDLQRVATADGEKYVKFLGYDVVTCGEVKFFDIDAIGPEVVRHVGKYGLVIRTGKTTDLAPYVYQNAVNRIAGPKGWEVCITCKHLPVYEPCIPPINVLLKA